MAKSPKLSMPQPPVDSPQPTSGTIERQSIPHHRAQDFVE
jgi:hypothetical protein